MSPGDCCKCRRWHAMNVCHEMLSMRGDCENNLLNACSETRGRSSARLPMQRFLSSRTIQRLEESILFFLFYPLLTFLSPVLQQQHATSLLLVWYASNYIAVIWCCNLLIENRLVFFHSTARKSFSTRLVSG